MKNEMTEKNKNITLLANRRFLKRTFDSNDICNNNIVYNNNFNSNNNNNNNNNNNLNNMNNNFSKNINYSFNRIAHSIIYIHLCIIFLFIYTNDI